MKEKKLHDHSIDAEKAIDKCQHLRVIKTLQISYRRNRPQHNKGHI